MHHLDYSVRSAGTNTYQRVQRAINDIIVTGLENAVVKCFVQGRWNEILCLRQQG